MAIPPKWLFRNCCSGRITAIPGSLCEFETCPGWGPVVDDDRRPTPILLKTHRVDRFDHNASGAAKVRNVSKLGSQIPKSLIALRSGRG
jgi:hypothetical protein